MGFFHPHSVGCLLKIETSRNPRSMWTEMLECLDLNMRWSEMGCGSTCQDLSFSLQSEITDRSGSPKRVGIFPEHVFHLGIHVAFGTKKSGLVFLQRHKMMAMVCAGISLSLGVSRVGPC